MKVDGQYTAFVAARDNMIMARQNKALEIDEEDWREMSKDTWDKMVESFDDYMDTCREELKKQQELQNEAAQKAAAAAPADMKAILAAQASLKAAVNGFFDILPTEETNASSISEWQTQHTPEE